MGKRMSASAIQNRMIVLKRLIDIVVTQALFCAKMAWRAETRGNEACLRRPYAVAVDGYGVAAFSRFASEGWCGRSESNRHTLRYWILSPARLPVPPRPHRPSL